MPTWNARRVFGSGCVVRTLSLHTSMSCITESEIEAKWSWLLIIDADLSVHRAGERLLAML